MKKELANGGASTGSARKGKVISEKEKAKILGRLKKNRMKKSVISEQEKARVLSKVHKNRMKKSTP